MIEEVRRDEVPTMGARLSPNGIFADEAVAEFAASGFEVAKVTGWPVDKKGTELAACLTGAIHRARKRRSVKAFTRNGVAYLERIAK